MRVAVYFRGLGWIVDTGVGGTFSFDVSQCQEWTSTEAAIDELRGCHMLGILQEPGTATLENREAAGIFILRVR